MSSRSAIESSNWYPPWAPRIWTGMRAGDYFRLLKNNRFRIHPSRYPMVGLLSAWSTFNSGMALVQRLLKNRAISATQIDQPPIFIIGHWRSGTTLLHELISQDENLSFPGTYDVCVPHHCLVSSFFIKSIMRLLLPGRRAFDNMSIDVDSPQEDEFAILILGAASYYERMGFPNQGDSFCDLLDSENLDDDDQRIVAAAIEYFFKALTLRDEKRLVLKSPPHTGRIKLLLRLFPNAKFVHLSRHPYQLVPSTMRLWRISDEIHAFQKPNYSEDELMAHIARAQRVMYGAYERDRKLLGGSQLIEISFEQLTAQPIETLARVYQQLELPGVKGVLDSARTYFDQRKEHRKNTHNTNQIRARIDADWAGYMGRFGYESIPHERDCHPAPDQLKSGIDA